MQDQFPNAVGIFDWPGGSGGGGHASQQFLDGIAMPSIALESTANLVCETSDFGHESFPRMSLWVSDNCNLRVIGSRDYGLPVQQEALACIQRQTGGAGFVHDFNRFYSHYRHIETHILIRFGDFYHRKVATQHRGIPLK